MTLEQLNARVMATVVFIVVATIGIVLSVFVVGILALYWDVTSIFGRGLRAGSFLDAMLNVLGWLLALSSIYLAYRLARMTHNRVVQYEASQRTVTADVDKLRNYQPFSQTQKHSPEACRKTTEAFRQR